MFPVYPEKFGCAISEIFLGEAMQSILRVVLTIGLASLVGGCASQFYVPQENSPTANVRFVATSPGNTSFNSSASEKCDGGYKGTLGFFNPMSAIMPIDAGRRGYDRRLGIPGGEIHSKYMYSELRVDATKPFYVKVSSTAPASANPYDVSICERSVLIPIESGKNYELVQVRSGGSCDFEYFELEESVQGVVRRPVPLAVKGPLCNGWGRPLSNVK